MIELKKRDIDAFQELKKMITVKFVNLNVIIDDFEMYEICYRDGESSKNNNKYSKHMVKKLFANPVSIYMMKDLEQVNQSVQTV